MIKKAAAVTLALLINVPLHSRDIDLDAIYLEKSSPLYGQITSAKEKLYSGISSLFIDSSVIFAEWASGDEIVYIKEFPGINVVYRYTKSTRGRDEIARFNGAVTAAALSRNGKFLIAKNLYYNDDAEAVSETVTVDVNAKGITRKKSDHLFLDFTLHPSGNGVVHETGRGIVKTDFTGGDSRLIIPRDRLSDVISGADPVLAFISPDERKSILISGNGGTYKTKVLTQSGGFELGGVSSNSDIRWIDNNRFIYRAGGGGDYSVRVFDLSSGKSRELITGTMNPDINFSEIPGLITCLDNQVITVVSKDMKKRIDTGIEGEESYFSPDGRKFTSIYLGKLYVNSLNMVEKYRMVIRRNAGELRKLYREAAVTRSSWQSDYSPEYIDKKIKQYDKYLKMEEIR